MSDFDNQTRQKSKKARRCVCTGATIAVGDYYIRESGCHEGDFFSVAIHDVVSPIYDRRNLIAFKDTDEGLLFQDLLEDIIEGTNIPERQADFEAIVALDGVWPWFRNRYEETTS